MEELPVKVMRSTIAFLTGAASGITLALVLIGSVDDSSGHPRAAMLTYAILATAMVASIYGLTIPTDSVAEKWRDLSSSCVTRRAIGFVSRVLRDAKPMTWHGVALTYAGVISGMLGHTQLLITVLGVVIALVSELSTFSTAIAATCVVVLQQVQTGLDHWVGGMRSVRVAMVVLMVIVLWHIMSKVAKVAFPFIAVCVACFYAALFAVMIVLTPVLILIHCLSQWLGRGLSSLITIAVGSATVIGIQGAIGPAALFITQVLLDLSQPDTKLGHGFWSLAIPVTIAIMAAQYNVFSVELDLKRVLVGALGVDTVQTLFDIRNTLLLFGVPIMLAISSSVAVQIIISPVQTHGGRLLAWACKGAALGSAVVLRMFGESLIFYGLVSFIVVWYTCHGFLQSSQSKTSQHVVSPLGGMPIVTLVIGCGVALFPRHWGLVMTGLCVYIVIKAVKLVLELEEDDSMLPGGDNVMNEEEYGIEKKMSTAQHYRSWN